ncbi:predicted protein [Sclerotinia sclerotiorum 1980 UF-70]|uniref:Uncharacterized protein n=2 Tax=Sclerotinia sclerotiorum (strain ATCC 18683 / 1980 / Ss-1) TaxID=665079 RepID=A7ELQ3_SCLS1|nr:predicted protein [Sclerotinia sclerotiorum 1980 UF-70]APA09598.1 hypothetical protein sscle_05g043680 [Sclerotinia sclerotiorum 1980 UF-70]EDO03769.1 predicted protein [Sclerotinia sclerotiorum 1980 UF-70]
MSFSNLFEELNTVTTVVTLRCATAECNHSEVLTTNIRLDLQPQWHVFKHEVEKEFLCFDYVKYEPEFPSAPENKDYKFIEFKCSECATTDSEKRFYDFAREQLPMIFIGKCRGYLETEHKGMQYDRESAVNYLKCISGHLVLEIHKEVRKEWLESLEKGKGKGRRERERREWIRCWRKR